ncbi:MULTISPECIES: AAA family ATPase [unclassified Sphingomonas]|uniref:AAA family ATPase n=1 Tax=unclassified Sphingomonas TaxID=196159 RepID=UPI002151906A|nr:MULTISPECIES: AAA family ATPase [unclassified Sphingomonas]MCR5870089.1 AAA family ATPase [Sphingomonas sp. J344]UUX98222.1 AAA family ATPase [Sphingomonas sp. J315]
MARETGRGAVKRGFLLGKFMPPHAGHLTLARAARAMCDRLTVLVCWLPDDPIPGEARLAWMRELLPDCKVIGHGAPVPQSPDESLDFWPIWRDIVRTVHPEAIDLLFAGEDYGKRLAAEVGGLFVPLGGRIMAADPEGIGGLSGSAVRADPWAHAAFLPGPVRAHYTRTVVLHGVESTGKSVLAERLARHFGSVWVPEYGRAQAEVHGIEMDAADLTMIGEAQSATIAAWKRWATRFLFADTDALMTTAWARMMLGSAPAALLNHPRADLYLLLEPDVAWVDDGTRVYGSDTSRARFAGLTRDVLEEAGVNWVSIRGTWDARFAAAVAAVETLARD